MAAGAKCLLLTRFTHFNKNKCIFQISRCLQAIPTEPVEYEPKIDKGHYSIQRQFELQKNTVQYTFMIGLSPNGFREYDLYQHGRRFKETKFIFGRFKRSKMNEPPPAIPRCTQMPTDQHWPNVWPTAKTFNWSQVPFNVRQGFTVYKAVPKKKGNLELMKIPNFLHLTPPHIKQHCEALKDLCTEWPQELQTDEDCKKYFPVEVVTSDYLFSGPSIRDERARICTVKFDLDDLELDYHARDKFLRLVGDRYDKETNTVTFVTDRCPLRKQNYDYAIYLMTAVYFESWTTEPWESEKEESDWETYHWDLSSSRKSVVSIVQQMKQVSSGPEGDTTPMEEEELLQTPEIQEYKRCVTVLHNQGENADTLTDYKNAVLQLYKVPTSSNTPIVIS
ncbi:hypothetical protein FSP39_019721 [Pinctada imbricata]|uniref:Small ribosomal subunit protein mS35 mitochondrial conserved domain-containing protein n=1 Tax=Pinctada imbricata TaxID=66713 RepID=A0AA88YK69_PINIB|nr:hypothetical protein FSP39_019721 [Pinctada imbricata]